MIYADVVVPLLLPHPLTYKVKEEETVVLGSIVSVVIGKGQKHNGFVLKIYKEPPHQGITYKSISEVLELPPISEPILRLWSWIASYYMCNISDVWRAAAPSGLELESMSARRRTVQTVVKIAPEWEMGERNYHKAKEWEAFTAEYSRSKKMLSVASAIREDGLSCGVTRNYLAEKYNTSSATIKKLIDAGFLIEVEEGEEEPPSLPQDEYKQYQKVWSEITSKLTQRERFTVVEGDFEYHKPYQSVPVQFIQEKLESGNVLLLYPTNDYLQEGWNYLSQLFGERIKRYVSDLTTSERREVWNSSLSGSHTLYVGLRAAALVPIKNVSAVVVLGEEDAWYKQTEPAPRFHAANVALMMGVVYSAPVILVSSMPSMECYSLIKKGNYAHFQWTNPKPKERPEMEIVDLSEAYTKHRVRGRLITFELQAGIAKALKRGEKTLLFFHRQGYAKGVVCQRCSHTESCPDCKIPLKIYQEGGQLICPICGFYKSPPEICSECGCEDLKVEGTGVERLAEELKQLYPEAQVTVDNDGKLSDWSSSDIVLSSAVRPDIRLLQAARCVAVVNLDILFSRPDFRARERVARALNEWLMLPDKLSSFLVQTFHPNDVVLEAFKEMGMEYFRGIELKNRFEVNYPPFSRLLTVEIEGVKRDLALKFSFEMFKRLSSDLEGCVILGPGPKMVKKVGMAYGYRLWVKIPIRLKVNEIKQKIKRAEYGVYVSTQASTRVRVYYDVDPVW